MQLIGYLDSPFVRRVAVSMRFLGIDFDHRELSIFSTYEEFRTVHPLVKVPTLVCDDGQMLIDSSLILDYLQSQVARRKLMPNSEDAYRSALQQIGVAMAAMEKVAQLIYETSQRPEEKQHGPWIERIEEQLAGAVGMMESFVSGMQQAWLHGNAISQADISIAVAYRFTQHIDRARIEPENYPSLAAFSARAEALPEFIACPLSG
ncbi:MAG: glutathione S-transferase [Lysobacterales bacterium]|jgi:glutathione S-transferase